MHEFGYVYIHTPVGINSLLPLCGEQTRVVSKYLYLVSLRLTLPSMLFISLALFIQAHGRYHVLELFSDSYTDLHHGFPFV